MPGGTELGDWTPPRGHRKEMRRAEPTSAPGDWKREDKCGAAEGGGGRAGEGRGGRAGAGCRPRAGRSPTSGRPRRRCLNLGLLVAGYSRRGGPASHGCWERRGASPGGPRRDLPAALLR